jgi:hypothetical protein
VPTLSRRHRAGRPPATKQSDRLWVGSSIQTAVEEAWREVSRAEAAKAKLTRIKRLIAWTDAMLDELEHENLTHPDRLSPGWRPRLALLFSSLPFEFWHMPRRLRTPADVQELIFEVQQRLFDLKHRCAARPIWSTGRPRVALKWR